MQTNGVNVRTLQFSTHVANLLGQARNTSNNWCKWVLYQKLTSRKNALRQESRYITRIDAWWLLISQSHVILHVINRAHVTTLLLSTHVAVYAQVVLKQLGFWSLMACALEPEREVYVMFLEFEHISLQSHAIVETQLWFCITKPKTHADGNLW